MFMYWLLCVTGCILVCMMKPLNEQTEIRDTHLQVTVKMAICSIQHTSKKPPREMREFDRLITNETKKESVANANDTNSFFFRSPRKPKEQPIKSDNMRLVQFGIERSHTRESFFPHQFQQKNKTH